MWKVVVNVVFAVVQGWRAPPAPRSSPGRAAGRGTALGSLLGIDDDASKTPEQNRAQRYRGTDEATGMGIDGVLGGLPGSLLGPAGAVAGALVGLIVGEKVGGAVGDWTKGLVEADIGGQIVSAWCVV